MLTRQVQVDNQREDARHPVLLKRKGEGKAALSFVTAEIWSTAWAT